MTMSASATPTEPVDATELPARARWRRAFTALATVLRDPEQTEQVLVFSTYANAGTMKDRIHRFLGDPRGRRLFEERRTIDAHSIDLAALGRLPEGTLGRAYFDFLASRGLTPDVFEHPPDNVRDPELAYVIMRLRQTHDLWHVVTGYDTDPASEVALQAFTYGQLRAPSAGILALLGTLKGTQLHRTLAVDVWKGYRLGRRARPLAVFPWEDFWTVPLAEVRALLGLPIVPTDAMKLGRQVRAAMAAIAATTPNASVTPEAATTKSETSSTMPGALATAPQSTSGQASATSPEAGDAAAVAGASASPSAPSAPNLASTELAQRFRDFVHDTPARARRARRAARRAFRAARAAA